jgi:hypothetical protein
MPFKFLKMSIKGRREAKNGRIAKKLGCGGGGAGRCRPHALLTKVTVEFVYRLLSLHLGYLIIQSYPDSPTFTLLRKQS